MEVVVSHAVVEPTVIENVADVEKVRKAIKSYEDAQTKKKKFEKIQKTAQNELLSVFPEDDEKTVKFVVQKWAKKKDGWHDKGVTRKRSVAGKTWDFAKLKKKLGKNYDKCFVQQVAVETNNPELFKDIMCALEKYEELVKMVSTDAPIFSERMVDELVDVGLVKTAAVENCWTQTYTNWSVQISEPLNEEQFEEKVIIL